MTDQTNVLDPQPGQPEVSAALLGGRAAPPWGDDAALVAAARSDPAAFGRLYDRYIQPLFRYLLGRLGSVHEAEDITAQTFLAALEAFPRYRHQGHFAAWLFSIARNKVIDHIRQQPRQASLDDAVEIPVETDLLQQVIKSERSAALVRLVSSLSPEERELVQLRYVAGLSFSEIAVLLERKEDAVKKALYRLLARMQSRLEESHD